jgi:hypothetical protein
MTKKNKRVIGYCHFCKREVFPPDLVRQADAALPEVVTFGDGKYGCVEHPGVLHEHDPKLAAKVAQARSNEEDDLH